MFFPAKAEKLEEDVIINFYTGNKRRKRPNMPKLTKNFLLTSELKNGRSAKAVATGKT